MSRVFNFSAGPAMLPLPVLEQAQEEMLDYRGTGMSVMEMSHRSKAYLSIISEAESLVRELMYLPENYRVLFLQGGATLQFTMIPMNLISERSSRQNATRQRADYLHTGSWSKKAIGEARKLIGAENVHVAGSGEADRFMRIPRQNELTLTPDAAYVHMTTNNTIFGTEYFYTPETGNVPLIADMSSNIFSREIDVSRFGILYAGAQKNLGPAGVTLVIIREDLMGQHNNLPLMLDYKAQADKHSMLNTPPTYAIYILGLVLQWIKSEGGISALEKRNIRKAQRLYDALDSSDFYNAPVEKMSRSRMNVPFTLTDDTLNDFFLAEAQKAGLVTLKGHRSVGGMRASIYNAMPEEGVDALIDFMRFFEKKQ